MQIQTLDDVIKKGKMPRREFLEYAGKGLAGLAGIGMGMKCKSNPTTPDIPDPKPPDPEPKINLNFTVYNHTQGQLGNFTMEDVDEGTWYEMSMDYIKSRGIDLSTVESRRMAIRKPNFRELVNKTTGQELSVRAPSRTTDYDIFLFNNGNGANYDEMDAQGTHLYNGRHDFKTYRNDHDGQRDDETKYPQKVWTGNSLSEIGGAPGVMVQINSIMNPAAEDRVCYLLAMTQKN